MRTKSAELERSRGSESRQNIDNTLPGDLYTSDDDLLRFTLPYARQKSFNSHCVTSQVRDNQFSARKLFQDYHYDIGMHGSISGGINSRSVVERSALDSFSVSSAALSRMFDGFSAKISAEIAEMRGTQMDEIRRLGSTLSDNVSREIQNIQGLFEMISNGIRGENAIRSGKKMSLSNWEEMMDGLTPYVTLIFGKDLFSRLLCFNAPLKVVDAYRKYGRNKISDVERASVSAQTLMFRLQPADKKYSHSGEAGKLHSDFKFSVVQNAFFNVTRENFPLFQKTGSSPENGRGEQEHKSGFGKGSSQSGRGVTWPAWLFKRKVSLDHVNNAKNFIETPGQSRKEKICQTPTPDDISFHGALRVYRLLGSHLHDGRSNFRVTFFQGVGYLMVPWHHRKVDIDQRSMKLCFRESEELSLRLENVRRTEQCPSNADITTINSVDATNKDILRKVFGERPGMILTVKHVVKITKRGNNGPQKSAQADGEIRVLRRLVNLIDVALDRCVEFCGVGSRETYLRTNNDSLRGVMIFALLFKAFYVEFMSMSDPTATSAAHRFPEPTEVRVFGTCLKKFIPGCDTQRSMMCSKCLEIPESTYDTLNHAHDDEEGVFEDAVVADQLLDVREIQESAELVVCVI